MKFNALQLLAKLNSALTISFSKSNLYCEFNNQHKFFTQVFMLEIILMKLEKKTYCRLPEVTYLKKVIFFRELEGTI